MNPIGTGCLAHDTRALKHARQHCSTAALHVVPCLSVGVATLGPAWQGQADEKSGSTPGGKQVPSM